MEELSRRRLATADSTFVYVAPERFVSNAAGDIFLAGRPNLLYRRDSTGRGAKVAEDSLLGAIVRADGTVDLVRPPFSARRLGYVDVLARPDGGWDVVMQEMRRGGTLQSRPPHDTTAALWHGVHDGIGWTHMEALPLPPRATIELFSHAPLSRMGDTLAWAIPASFFPHGSRVVTLIRESGVWNVDVTPISQTLYPSLVIMPDGTRWLATVGSDPDHEGDVNSLFLWTRDSTWRRAGVVADSHVYGEAHNPFLRTTPAGLLLAWYAETDGRRVVALVDDVRTLSPPTLLSVDATTFWSDLHVVELPDGRLLWVTEHATSQGSPPLIRFTLRDHGERRGTFVSPFVVRARAAALPENRLLLTGAGESVSEHLAYSLVVEVQMSCLSAR